MTGVQTCALPISSDAITSTHRGHGHCIAKGGDVRLMFAELLGKATGYNRGKGGSMHIADLDLGILGANGIVGGGPPIAVGAAFAAQYRKRGGVAVCFSGDGSTNEGTWHEAMNFAGLLKLPAIFIVENNHWGEFTRQEAQGAISQLSLRAAAYGPTIIAYRNGNPVRLDEVAHVFDGVATTRLDLIDAMYKAVDESVTDDQMQTIEANACQIGRAHV